MGVETNRFAKQEDLVPQAKLTVIGATVIGVGAIGRQVALQLATIGLRRIRLIDFDAVDLSNVTTQGYYRADVGQAKVEATATAIARIDPDIVVEIVCDRFRPKLLLLDCVFCCVDSIDTRSAIWRSAREECQFWSDARMPGEVVRILSAVDGAGRQYYSTTLFSGANAQIGSCTAHSTIYAANIAAALMVHQLTRWLRGLPVDRDLSLNLLAGERSAASFANSPNVLTAQPALCFSQAGLSVFALHAQKRRDL
jgi:molybdopterin-synthase adenylyltransferase